MTDLEMPDMSGWELARALKIRSPGLPVIILTGLAEAVATSEASPCPADCIVAKPIQLGKLLGIIAELVAQGGCATKASARITNPNAPATSRRILIPNHFPHRPPQPALPALAPGKCHPDGLTMPQAQDSLARIVCSQPNAPWKRDTERFPGRLGRHLALLCRPRAPGRGGRRWAGWRPAARGVCVARGERLWQPRVCNCSVSLQWWTDRLPVFARPRRGFRRSRPTSGAAIIPYLLLSRRRWGNGVAGNELEPKADGLRWRRRRCKSRQERLGDHLT